MLSKEKFILGMASFLKMLPIFLITVIALPGCNLLSQDNSNNDTNLQATIAYLEMQGTVQALQAALSATPPMQVAATIVPTAPIVPTNTPFQTQPQTNPTPQAPNFEERMKDAKILLFEDMIGRPKTRRYVKETLEKMRLPFEDVGSAKGTLKERLTLGAAGGQPWDLIILAIENRDAGSVTGEFFEYAISNMDRGSAVIIEAWHLDQIKNGRIRPLLDRCGVDVRNYTASAGSNTELLLWPLSNHPILTDPNNYVKLTAPLLYWKPEDYGDLMNLTGTGDAQLLIGRDIADTDKYGVVTVCMNGQLIIQTFSSHNYYIEPMMALWENYIYNALKVHFSN